MSTSSMQSKYQALYAGMQENMRLRGVLSELKILMIEPSPFFLDSRSVEGLAMNLTNHKWSKHMETNNHWVRKHVDADGEFMAARLFHVHIGVQIADIFPLRR